MCIIEPYHRTRHSPIWSRPVSALYSFDKHKHNYWYWGSICITDTFDAATAISHLSPSADSYLGKSLLPWFNWWTNFIEPFASILSNLGMVTWMGTFSPREKHKYSRCHRLISFTNSLWWPRVDREIPSSSRRIVASIEKGRQRFGAVRRILHTYFIDNGAALASTWLGMSFLSFISSLSLCKSGTFKLLCIHLVFWLTFITLLLLFISARSVRVFNLLRACSSSQPCLRKMSS